MYHRESSSAKVHVCLSQPLLSIYSSVPFLDTSKRAPYLWCAEAALPSILNPESWVRELTVVLSHPSILVLLWRENSSTAVEFPSPVSSEEGSAGCPDQTGPQCGAESSLKTRAGACIKDSPQGHSSWKFYFSKAQILLLPGEFVCVCVPECVHMCFRLFQIP